ncbi:imidazole glycerol phosphate synthase subunit HisH [Chitinivibrio alkaliphilus]|uniref:Imidazole glycerol phosphate synthase subunit HisH n=1 Tax=Chitinivibrio alkaliphilus ACht1 TaxID=1313304 RepID=U7D6F0_9BACT|nr:imidazole glycerol phosphate synthase subunit HisH [Chitinivibrio alkaliphilus]ERP30667.1 imidazole glycerol phosphate synthase subunit HisH [Chitinivibrio alkaliphilus ACht1]
MIAIIDYKAGNLTSVQRAFDEIGVESVVTDSLTTIARAERLVFPGVGHAQSAMKNLLERRLDRALKDAYAAKTPLLGICLGTQIILEHSEEGDTDTLQLIPGQCRRFSLSDPSLSIPHMGWNTVLQRQDHPLFANIPAQESFYFVHSYYPTVDEPSCVMAETEYEIPFCSALGKNNLFATQFHPEKSGQAGLQLLRNFSLWDGTSC